MEFDSANEAGYFVAPSHEIPEDHLAGHPLTQELKRLGASDEQLEGMRFRANNGWCAYDLWSFTYLADTPEVAIPLIKAYCALKWLILENPPHSRERDDAWRHISETIAAPTYHLGVQMRQRQSERAKKPRGKLPGDGRTIAQIVADLVRNPEHRDELIKELWPHFRAELECCDLDPKDVESSSVIEKWAYTYEFRGRRKKITYRHFANLVTKARNQK